MNKAEAGRLGGRAKVSKGFGKMSAARLAEVVAKSMASNKARREAAKQLNKREGQDN